MTYEMKILEERRDAWQQSREIALAEGLERGANNRSIEIASRMLSNNAPLEDILLYTELSKEEIEGLRNV